MKRNRKPEIVELTEGVGLFTLRCHSKEEAIKLMKDFVSRESELEPQWWSEYRGYSSDEITEDTVKEERMYQHRSCGYSIGDSLCFECGEPCGTVGRKTYVFYAD